MPQAAAPILDSTIAFCPQRRCRRSGPSQSFFGDPSAGLVQLNTLKRPAGSMGFRLHVFEVKSATISSRRSLRAKDLGEAWPFLYRERDRVRATWFEPRAPIVGSSKGWNDPFVVRGAGKFPGRSGASSWNRGSRSGSPWSR
jgi:hypothetical protein